MHAAHGWAWREAWVRGGRFRAEYVVGGVVSGRWATRGGGALQIPRLLRGAVVADPGHRLVVADAGQLEPRVLAAMSGDAGLARAAAAGDLYAALARDAFSGDRPRAKIALLAAMYGQTSGEAGQLLAVMRRRFPAALALVESAARTGEAGGVVRSQLGRTSPTPSAQRFLDESADPGDGASPDRRAARSWGRFTRNFVIQASASDWALAMLAALRRRLAAIGPEPRLVFFQHDEVVVHTPAELAGVVEEAVTAAGDEARRLVFGATPVLFPAGDARGGVLRGRQVGPFGGHLSPAASDSSAAAAEAASLTSFCMWARSEADGAGEAPAARSRGPGGGGGRGAGRPSGRFRRTPSAAPPLPAPRPAAAPPSLSGASLGRRLRSDTLRVAPCAHGVQVRAALVQHRQQGLAEGQLVAQELLDRRLALGRGRVHALLQPGDRTALGGGAVEAGQRAVDPAVDLRHAAAQGLRGPADAGVRAFRGGAVVLGVAVALSATALPAAPSTAAMVAVAATALRILRLLGMLVLPFCRTVRPAQRAS